jgi:hypothetical protein
MNEIVMSKILCILKKYLWSPYLDKKLTALNEIKRHSEGKENSEFMCKWIVDEQIIEYIFNDSNPELISRSVALLLLLAQHSKLTEAYIQLLWTTCVDEHKHEAVVEETLIAIQEIAKKLPSSHIDIFISEIRKLTTADEKMVVFLKNFYLNTFQNMKFRV